jgi:aminoglycoside 6'-N-acetyltransferase
MALAGRHWRKPGLGRGRASANSITLVYTRTLKVQGTFPLKTGSVKRRQVVLHSIVFRPITVSDLPNVSRWLAQPHVQRWWRDPTELSAVEAKYLPCIDGRDPTEIFVIEIDGSAGGFIQRYLIADEPAWTAVLRVTGTTGWESAFGIDYLIGDPALTGRGIGSAAIRQFTADSFARYPQADSVVVDVQQANIASWRALERAGFARFWAGQLDSDDPSDAGPSFLYRKTRDPA